MNSCPNQSILKEQRSGQQLSLEHDHAEHPTPERRVLQSRTADPGESKKAEEQNSKSPKINELTPELTNTELIWNY